MLGDHATDESNMIFTEKSIIRQQYTEFCKRQIKGSEYAALWPEWKIIWITVKILQGTQPKIYLVCACSHIHLLRGVRS